MKGKVLQLAAIDMTLYKFMLPLMKELQKEEFEVIAACKDFGYLGYIEKEGFKTYNVPMTRTLNPFHLIRSIISLYTILKREKIEILHVHTPIAAFVGRLAAKLAGVRVKVYTVHGLITDKKIFYWIEKFMAQYFTDFIFTVNREDWEIMINEGFVQEDRIRNINSVGIDIKKFDPSSIHEREKKNLRKSLGIDERSKVLGFVGRLVVEKGVLDLLHAYINVRQEMQEEVKLLLVGPWNLGERDQGCIDKIKTVIDEYHLQEDVLLTGPREDIPQLLSIMDVFVLPSYREGMPVSLLEAMAMELPVIASNIKGCREEVDETTGFLFQPKEIDLLTAHIVYLLKNVDQAKWMGINGRKKVSMYFQQEEVARKQVEVYKNFLFYKNF